MHLFFQQNPFRPDATSDLENDAKLALHLVLFLISTQDLDDGTWRGIHVGATLRNTCHALEALHLLGWEVSAGTVEAGIGWLLNLPDIFSLVSEEEEPIRLHPSRFKTLAWLGKFTNPQLRSDFEELEEHLDEDGLLRGIMAKQLLATMVYIDCLDHLEKLGSLSMLSQGRRERALNCIQQNVFQWHQDLRQNTQHSHITTAGDLSYAMDILLRANRLSKQDEISKDMLAVLISALKHLESLRPMPSDTLYCEIQLATHFPEVAEAKEVVRALIDHLRIKYEKLDLKKEAELFHPLVLRVLLAYHGDQLKAEMIKLMLEQEQRNLELRRQSVEQDLRDDFRTLIKRQFEVEISEVQPLTGGITKAKVFRVHFSLKLRSMGEEGEARIDTYHPSPGSLVIKSGSLDSLRTSIWRYRNLPDAVKPYFAKHAGDPHMLEAAPWAPCYLVMEDLTYMSTFRDLISRIDQGSLSRVQKRELERACDTICTGLFALYDQTRRSDTDFFGSQLPRLYISDLEKNLIRMCRAEKFPHLKPWLRGFWLGERKYLSIEHYLRKLESHVAKLKVPYLMLVHGDCHSRNIMLDAQLRRLKLIDLDNLDYDGDYIRDPALLIEDVSVFRFLFDEGYRFYLDKGQISFVSDSTEPRVIENKIEYPPFSSEAIRLFQHYVLRRMEAYAQDISDKSWKERLWLALAASLIFLVAKQTEKEYATVVYVEAVKLLDDLVSCLDEKSPLGDIPFPGQHPAGVKRESGRDAMLPSWYRDGTVLADVHDGIIALDPNIKCELTSSGCVTQYFVANSQQPFAVIDGKKQPPSVLLACSPQALDDPAGMAQERETSSALRTVLLVSENKGASTVLNLIQQAFQLNRAGETIHNGAK